MADAKWEQFDPSWLVELARQQLAEKPGIAQALSRVQRVLRKSVAYWYFVPSVGANEPGSEWQFAGCVMLNCPQHGELVLDVLKDGRIGGVEFLARVGEVD